MLGAQRKDMFAPNTLVHLEYYRRLLWWDHMIAKLEHMFSQGQNISLNQTLIHDFP